MESLFFHTNPHENLLVITVGVPKDHLETTLGRELSENEYTQMVFDTIPQDHLQVTPIKREEIPHEFDDFREAWCDITPERKIDICHKRAKEIQLTKLRKLRDDALKKTDEDFIKALSTANQTVVSSINDQKQKLRDLTEPLKTFNVDGYNDKDILNKIRELGKFNV